MSDTYLGISISYERDALFDEFGLKRMRQSYMRDDEKSPQERFAFVSKTFGSNPEHAQRLYEYSSQHWLSYATPILAFGRTKKSLPISCFLSNLSDSRESLVNTLSEVNWLSMLGGGIGIGVNIRSADEKSVGVMPHLKTYDASSLAYRQGSCYLPETKVFTNLGYVYFENLDKTKHKVGMVTDSGNIEFTSNYEIVEEDYTGKIIQYTSKYVDIGVTSNHKMVFSQMRWKGNDRDFSGDYQLLNADQFYPKNDKHILHLGCNGIEQKSAKLTAYERFLIALQADGSIVKKINGKLADTLACTFHFSKERKINRILEILNDCGFSYTTKVKDTTSIYVKVPKEKVFSKTFDWVDLSTVDKQWCLEFIKELSEWDGHKVVGKDSITYATVSEFNSNVVQAVCTAAGIFCRKNTGIRKAPRKTIYNLYISYTKDRYTTNKIKRTEYDYSGKVFCVEVPTHKLLVERNGKTLVCGNTRRGSYAVYLDIDHPDIIKFTELRKPTGDINQRCQNLHHGVNISDKFMKLIERCTKDANVDDSWELIDPHTKEVKQTISAKYLWELLLSTRMMTGEPYFHFIDTSNAALPPWQKELGLSIKQSNLCNEVFLATDNTRTAVCCLSSLNLEYYDDWKDNKQFLEDVAEMLDNVLEYFILNAQNEIKRATYSAKQERSIGIGTLGFHSYLQKKGIAFESVTAKAINKKIYKNIKETLWEFNKKLGAERGACPDAEKNGYRFSHMTAIAPNASTSILLGNTSPSIEPYAANIFRQETIGGLNVYKNKHLDKKIDEICLEKGLDKDQIWSEILSNEGSIQNLDYFDDITKFIFKNAKEIDQRWIITLASDRQEFIDQGQSLNLFFPADIDIKYLHDIHFSAWKLGLKGLYYCRTEKITKIDKVGKAVVRKEIKSNDSDCIACEG